MISRSSTVWLLTTVLLIGVVSLSGCAQDATPPAATEQPTEPAQEQTTTPSTTEGTDLYTPQYMPNGNETAVLSTSKGEITVELYGKDAPIHVGSFVELARKSFYDGTKFHRYEPGFVVQGGDPLTKDYSSEDVAAAVNDPYSSPFGKSGPGYTIKGEFDMSRNPNTHVEGALGMARSGHPDSAGSQFYFALQPIHQLDGSYTVFGKVTKGLDVMKSLRAGDEIEKIEIIGATE